MTLDPSNDRIPRDEWRKAKELAEQFEFNRMFATLPSEKQRVIIAKDVLKWLRLGKLVPIKQSYLELPAEVQAEGVVNGYSCQACALGGIFACFVERGLAGGKINMYEGGDRIRGGLSPYFDAEQLGLIEISYEGPWRSSAPDDDYGAPSAAYAVAGCSERFDGEPTGKSPAVRAAERFNNGVRNKRTRMENIMHNIIKHKGTFVPEDRPSKTTRKNGATK